MQSCLGRAEGNQQLADYLADCSYWEYYFRVLQYNKYVQKKNDALKAAQK